MDSTFVHIDFKLNGNSFKGKDKFLAFVKVEVKEVYSFLSNWFDDSDFIAVNTSGSTGKPKRIKLRKEFMRNSAKATGEFFGIKAGTTALMCLPVEFIAGKMMLVRAMVLGWNLDVIVPDSFPLKGVNKSYDFSAMVPLQLFNSLNEIEKIKKLIVGGGVVSNALQSKIKNLSTKIYATYGMTETITHIAIKPLNKSSLRGGRMWQSLHNYTVLPNIKITTDHRNCLVIHAPKVSNEKIITNDLVKIISETQFKWLGRYDHMINSGGIKLIPEQIEEKLSKIIKQRFFVTGLPDDVLGDKLVLIIEDQEFKFKIQNLKFKINNLPSLDKFEIPKEIYFVKRFEETETKKIQRQKTLDKISIN